ncbi:MAG TPA: T9SS type A sorting domain-containing protein, partial [bacterium]|nr:T9SS type A sorting domain-containing protein [bacterium]
NVIFSSQELSGIIFAAGADGGPADIRDILLRGNIIYDNAVAGIVVQGWSPITRVRIYHNTLSGNREGDLLVGGTVDSVEVRNNIFSHSGRRPHISVERSVTHFTARRNLYDPSPKTLENASDAEALEAAPGFVSVDQRDFSLRLGSPAIDAGIDLGWPYAGSAPDLGAIESDLRTSSGSVSEEDAQAVGLYFENCTPNPCNGEMQFHYRLAADSAIKMEIYDITGRLVTRLVDAQQSKGQHAQRWNGCDNRGRRVPSGLYFCLLRTDSEQIVKKLIRAY